ncbi:hypothetical protein LXA47_12860 [Massilia sp. P8910]|uniref:Uncharacterized protein n=1 Tax=Massilia antarctica TaxID=2765360 RepID=A0AA48WBX3_9BURK|nr:MULTISPECIES: hypothetical protein [Massilia]CUI04406.1 hypothetical protein BN2497_3589 [Janthinobacterium sp. CG23_2]MCE3604494.1 hypothetical protein [Massilia antarctica]MCY0913864.1 hypothetical protein [Massilia sp. H27-R4]QPI49740.1 hypothetical protein IV454_30715 [Massilia antarctica]CUU28192.1 hypothetical protein BN3177_3589 [Janthinobacterium sp. CG23_2]
MNIAKHMEAIFLAVVAVIGATTFATAGAPLQRSAPGVAAAAAPGAVMPVVVVSARRLSAAEKAQLPQ